MSNDIYSACESRKQFSNVLLSTLPSTSSTCVGRKQLSNFIFTNRLRTSCHRIEFLSRDAMHKRGICRHPVSVCLSVCLSVTFVSCAKTNIDIFEIFSPSGSQAILVFPYQTGWRYSDGNPPNGGVECKGV